ncbi:hypothetical protein BDR22DRAFT_895722 [Usnea florida]
MLLASSELMIPGLSAEQTDPCKPWLRQRSTRHLTRFGTPTKAVRISVSDSAIHSASTPPPPRGSERGGTREVSAAATSGRRGAYCGEARATATAPGHRGGRALRRRKSSSSTAPGYVTARATSMQSHACALHDFPATQLHASAMHRFSPPSMLWFSPTLHPATLTARTVWGQ